MTPRPHVTGVNACRRVAAPAAVVALGAITAWAATNLAAAPPPSVVLASYATSLRGRTGGQRHNAMLAARSLDGAVISAGATLSFNQTVTSWSADQGYVKAPVSFDGELVRAFGGGVCQTSTTLYNAALLAGLDVVERHRHTHVPRYVAPGRDAAVAFPTIDLRLRNPYPWAVRIGAHIEGDRLALSITGRQRPNGTVDVVTRVLDRYEPTRAVRLAAGSGSSRSQGIARSPGVPGYRVVTWRVTSRDGGVVRRERLSDDAYPALHHIVRVGVGGAGE